MSSCVFCKEGQHSAVSFDGWFHKACYTLATNNSDTLRYDHCLECSKPAEKDIQGVEVVFIANFSRWMCSPCWLKRCGQTWPFLGVAFVTDKDYNF